MKSNKKQNSIYLAILALMSLASMASGQITVFAESQKRQFIAHEPTRINITITNRAGQPINFRNTQENPWIEFIVENTNGRPLHALNKVAYKPTTVPTGRTVTTSFTVSNTFDLSQPGNYSAYAIVRMPGQDVKQGIRSNKVHFTVINGFVSWRQKAGVPGTAGDTREYRIMNVSGNGQSDLYVQVEDVKRGRMLATYSMGRNLSFRQFKATTDRASNLHVLFLTSPDIHCHTVVNPAGKPIKRIYHKLGPGGTTPKLFTTDTGTVGVIDSTIYDPKKEKEKKRQIHNLSELPNGISQ